MTEIDLLSGLTAMFAGQASNPTPPIIRSAVQAYIRAVAAGDPQGIAALFAPDAILEDPVGGPMYVGRNNIRAFFADAYAALGGVIDFAAQSAIRVAGKQAALTLLTRIPRTVAPFEVRSADIITFDAGGLIESLRAYAGISDVSPAIVDNADTAPGFDFTAMYAGQRASPSPAHIRSVIELYARAVSASDAGAILRLFSPDATLADPVGGPLYRGRNEIGQFFQGSFDAISGGFDFRTEGAIRVAGNVGVAAMNARALKHTEPFHVRSVDVIHFTADGLISGLEAYYGATDLYVMRSSNSDRG